jgi:hypothetical protein
VSAPDPGAQQRRGAALLTIRSLATARLAIDSAESPGIPVYEALLSDVAAGIFRSSPDPQIIALAVADHLAAFADLVWMELFAAVSAADSDWLDHPGAVTPAMLHEASCRMLEQMS